MPDRKKNAGTCTVCRIVHTRRRSGICLVCSEGVRVERCPRGLRICGQVVVSPEQGRELADKLHDLLDELEAGS